MSRRRRSSRHHSSRKSSRWGVIFFISVVLMAAIVGGWLYRGLLMPLELPDSGYRLEIKKGDSFNRVIDALAKDTIIPDALAAKLWLKMQGTQPVLHPGIWLLRSPLNALDVVQLLVQADKSSLSRLTVVEGITYKDLRQLLLDREDIQHDSGSDAEILMAIGAAEAHPEGLFAPDTYDLSSDGSELSFLKSLYERQQKILAEEWEGRAQGLPYQSPYEALIMASIVEKETGVASERSQIAGVFVRRLQKGMRLQTDPTVIYGMGERYQGRIRRADLMRRTDYNTYRINGLPPTPIALPGRAAIHAALHPAEGDAIYFVARGDGSHEFSATLADHNRAVERYQKKRRADYRAAPSVTGNTSISDKMEIDSLSGGAPSAYGIEPPMTETKPSASRVESSSPAATSNGIKK